jgi:hypothetical protein
VLTLDGDIERWDPLPPMHEAREYFACAAIGKCVVVAGGEDSFTAEVYEPVVRIRLQPRCARAVEAASLRPSLRHRAMADG